MAASAPAPASAAGSGPVSTAPKIAPSTLDGTDYSFRMVAIPKNTSTLDQYLQEGFWPQSISVFTDFGVSVSYLVDGDALLAHCFEDALVDWKHGGQPLHIMYLFHRFLNMLEERHARSYTLLFCSSMWRAWKGSRLAIRCALMKYLSATCPEILVITDIESIWDTRFDDMLRLRQPAYLISKREFLSGPEIDPLLATGCHAFMLHALNSNMSVVLLDRKTAFAGPHVHAWCLLERPADAISVRLLNEAKTVITEVSPPSLAPVARVNTVGFEPRVAMAIAVVKAAVAAADGATAKDPVFTDLAKAFVAHAVLLGYFAPSMRASTLPNTMPSTPHLIKLPLFLDTLWGFFVSLLSDDGVETTAVGGAAAGGGGGGADAAAAAAQSGCVMSDLWDGRFLTRLIVAATATTTLGLSASMTGTIQKAIEAAGLDGPLEPLCRGASPADVAACNEVMAHAVAAVTQAVYTDVAIPRLASSFLDNVIPDVLKLHGFVRAPAAIAASKDAYSSSAAAAGAAIVAAFKATAAAAAAVVEVEIADSWEDDDSTWETDLDDAKAASASAAASPPASTAAGAGASAAVSAETTASSCRDLALSNVPPPIEPWISIDPAVNEADAYRSIDSAQRYHEERDRCLFLLKRLVTKLKQRSHNRLSEFELVNFYRDVINEFRAIVNGRMDDERAGMVVETMCADDLTTEYERNRFSNMDRVVRRWMPKFVSSAFRTRVKAEIMKFAENLHSRIIQRDTIRETDEGVSTQKQTLRAVFAAATNAVRSAKETAESRSVDLRNTMSQVAQSRRRGKFADAWKALDDFLLDRCTKDEYTYAKTERTVLRVIERVESSGNRAGDLPTLLSESASLKESIRAHNVRVIGGEARLQTTFQWWQQTYVARLTRALASHDAAVVVNAQDAERWAVGKVIAEMLELVDLARKQGTLNDSLTVTLASMLNVIGFTDASTAFVTEASTWVKPLEPVVLDERSLAVIARATPVVDRNGQSLADFQMACMGPLLVRPAGKVDERILRFKPDLWQIDLIDLVDKTEEWRGECRKLLGNKSGAASKAKTLFEASEMLRTRAKDPIQAQSILINAPTSGGKTFISFYIMEQVLREPTKGDGLVVFVAPTKALVNQVEADLYARFDKSFHRDSKVKHLHGIFTKEIRTNVNDCQVLITIPECLELLFMMSRHNKLVKRMRWIIFDEVHCIAKEGGATWERLLVTCPCPFVALSATIGNPNEFGQWLQDLERAKGRELTVIEVDLRINDLLLHVYDSRDMKRQRESDRAVPLNPLGIMSVELLERAGGVPKQIKLLPEHCQVVAYKCRKLCTDIDDPILREMVNEVDMSSRNELKALSMGDAAAFEVKIKKIVWWLVTNKRELAQELIADLGKLPIQIMNCQDEVSSADPFQYLTDNILPCLRALDSAGAGSDDLQGDLKRLPAIVFHLSVRGCNAMLKKIVDTLEIEQNVHQCRKLCLTVLKGSREQCEQQKLLGFESDIIYRIRATGYTREDLANESEETRRKVETIQQDPSTIVMDDVNRFLEIDRITDWSKTLSEEAAEILEKLKAARDRYYHSVMAKCDQENTKRQKEYDAEVAACRDEAEMPPPIESVMYEHLKPEYVDPRYSFLPGGQGVTEDDLKRMLGRSYDRTHYRAKSLQRGVGVHYAELPRKYKNGVEQFFRLKRLRVVIATGTLALGINMPCKTVIIAGDEPEFNSLDYHQMIGRAGRRTFDNRGNVVFLGTPSRKIRRLISTPVADLVGNVPLTPALALRVLLRFVQSTNREDKELVVQQTKCLVNNMLFQMGCPGQVAHQLLFCNDFLMGPTLRLLEPSNNDVVPSNIASLVALFYYMEPYNFPFIAAVQRGLFEKLLRKYVLPETATEVEHEQNDRNRNIALLKVCAHFMMSKSLPDRMCSGSTWTTALPVRHEDALEMATSPRLPPLPEDFTKFLSAYNAEVLGKYSGYLRKYAAVEAKSLGNINVLPGCGSKESVKNVFVEKPGEVSAAGGDTAIGLLNNSTIQVQVRSPFIALSGHGDSFDTLHDLLNSHRSGIYLDRALVPVFVELNEPVNSWIVDFYLTRDRARLSAKNGLRDEKLYDMIELFTQSLAVMRKALKRRLDATKEAAVVAAPVHAGGNGDDDDGDDDELVVEEEDDLTRVTDESSDLEIVYHGFSSLYSSFKNVSDVVFEF